MDLNVTERIIALGLLQAPKGNLETLRAIGKARSELVLTQEECQAIGYRFDQATGAHTWARDENPETAQAQMAAASESVPIDIPQAALDYLAARLEALNAAGEMEESMLLLAEKFLPAAEAA